MEALKQCGTCQKWLPLEAFFKNKAYEDGKHLHCRQCAAGRRRKWLRAKTRAATPSPAMARRPSAIPGRDLVDQFRMHQLRNQRAVMIRRLTAEMGFTAKGAEECVDTFLASMQWVLDETGELPGPPARILASAPGGLQREDGHGEEA